MNLLVPMIHPWKGERLVHPKAAPKYEQNGWRQKPPDPPKRRRSRQTETPQAPETDSGAFSLPDESTTQESE